MMLEKAVTCQIQTPSPLQRTSFVRQRLVFSHNNRMASCAHLSATWGDVAVHRQNSCDNNQWNSTNGDKKDRHSVVNL
jgi:hypothetical protein